MLFNAKTLRGFKLSGVDGEVGKVKEFFFDDRFWTIRYLVADTGGWLSDRQVLISPYFLETIDSDSKLINVTLTKDEIENSPPLESDMPLSRQFEERYYGHYGAPLYWTGPQVWGTYPYVTSDREKWGEVPSSPETEWDTNLQSTKDVSKNPIFATDGEIGEVEDFIIDDETWEIRYLIIDTGKWLNGKKVLVSPGWINEISQAESKVVVNVSRNQIENSPEYVEEDFNRDYESKLHTYYERPAYWSEEWVSRDYPGKY